MLIHGTRKGADQKCREPTISRNTPSGPCCLTRATAIFDPRLPELSRVSFGFGNCERGAAHPAYFPLWGRGRSALRLHSSSSTSSHSLIKQSDKSPCALPW